MNENRRKMSNKRKYKIKYIVAIYAINIIKEFSVAKFPFISLRQFRSRVFTLNMPARLSQDNKKIRVCAYFTR